jgi:hypothetical protein
MRISHIVLFMGILCLIAGTGCISGVLPKRSDVVYPHIGTPVPASSPIPVDYRWRFEGGEKAITASVDGGVYRAAQRADKNATLFGDHKETEWMTGYYRAFINDPAQEDLYQSLAGEFREIRDTEHLDESRYLELMMVFVQSIPYKTDTDKTLPKFPIETFVDREGDCDDKSILLAALLEHEGYNVSLLYFGPEQHVAVGIGGNGPGYRGTGYIFVETTNLSYVSVPPEALAGGVVLSSQPLAIPVGSGSGTYTVLGEVGYIQDRLSAADAEIRRLDAELEGMRQQMDEARREGRVREYNALVPVYNSMLAEYRDSAAVHDYILLHRFDRPGTFQWLRARAY